MPWPGNSTQTLFKIMKRRCNFAFQIVAELGESKNTHQRSMHKLNSTSSLKIKSNRPMGLEVCVRGSIGGLRCGGIPIPGRSCQPDCSSDALRRQLLHGQACGSRDSRTMQIWTSRRCRANARTSSIGWPSQRYGFNFVFGITLRMKARVVSYLALFQALV